MSFQTRLYCPDNDEVDETKDYTPDKSQDEPDDHSKRIVRYILFKI